MSRRKQRAKGEPKDLDLLPMMNLFVVLIPMLLLSAVFVELAVIRMGLPSDDAAPVAPAPTLGLSISIEEDRWIVRASELEERAIDRSAAASIETLRATLGDVTTRFPDNRDVVILSRPTTRYEDIISVMDVSRETGLENVSLLGAES